MVIGARDVGTSIANTDIKVIFTKLRTCTSCGGNQFRVPQEYQKALYKPLRMEMSKWTELVKMNDQMIEEADCHLCGETGGVASNMAKTLMSQGRKVAADMVKAQSGN